MWRVTSKVWSKNVQSPNFNPHSRMESDDAIRKNKRNFPGIATYTLARRVTRYENSKALSRSYFNPHSRTESDVFVAEWGLAFYLFQSTLSHGE